MHACFKLFVIRQIYLEAYSKRDIFVRSMTIIQLYDLKSLFYDVLF